MLGCCCSTSSGPATAAATGVEPAGCVLKAKRIPRRAEAPGRREPKDISAVKTLVPTELASRRFFLRCPHQGGYSLWPVCPTAATGQFQACLLQARLAAQCFEALRLLQARSAARCREPPFYIPPPCLLSAAASLCTASCSPEKCLAHRGSSAGCCYCSQASSIRAMYSINRWRST